MKDATKVNPVYSTIDYWKKWRPYAHKALKRYTNDQDLHGNFDYELYLFFKRAVNLFDNNRNIRAYIRSTIKGLAMRLFGKPYKYTKTNDEIITEPQENTVRLSYIDTTVDDYLMQQHLLKYISRLDKRDQYIIKHYYGLDNKEVLTMVDMAKILGISPTKVRWIRERGTKKLRSIITNKGLTMEDFING